MESVVRLLAQTPSFAIIVLTSGCISIVMAGMVDETMLLISNVERA